MRLRTLEGDILAPDIPLYTRDIEATVRNVVDGAGRGAGEIPTRKAESQGGPVDGLEDHSVGCVLGSHERRQTQPTFRRTSTASTPSLRRIRQISAPDTSPPVSSAWGV